MEDFYFQNYAEWRHAFAERCKIPLTPQYAQERIEALKNPSDPSTAEFTATYGEAYLQQVITWFENVRNTA